MDSQSPQFSPAFSPQHASRPPHAPQHGMPDYRAGPSAGQMYPNGPQPFSPQPQTQSLDGNMFPSNNNRKPSNTLQAGQPLREVPANTKNTSHVPCKFFRLGNCQAGKACPFSHALDTINDPAPCKYFAKGNCKYGHKCANPHLLPDGRDGRKLNHGRRAYMPENGGFNIGPPAHPGQYSEQMPQTAFPILPPPSSASHDHYISSSEDHFPPGLQQRTLDTLPTIDQAYNTRAGLQFGSPPRESRQALSPPLRALDAQLPSSFDSNGVSNVARYGHIASSVPSRFGFGPSSPTVSTATSNVFGNLGHMARGDANGGRSGSGSGSGSGAGKTTESGTSPPANTEHVFPKRILHSDRISQPQHIASSLPVPRPMMRMQKTVDSDEDSDDDKVNWLPGALSDDVMTPQEKMRRFSRHEEDNAFGAKGSFSAIGSAQDSKVGSPSNASPASRWGALFAAQRQQETNDYPSTSPYGHIGSPLRNASLPSNASPSIKPIARPMPLSGDVSPFGMSSPPTARQPTVVGGGIGMLSEQLKNSRLRETSTASDSAPQPQSQPHAPAVRSISNGSVASVVGSARLDRAISSSSISRSERIDEEPFVFEMDEVDLRVRELKSQTEKDRQKRWSGGLPFSGNPWNAGNPWNNTAANEAEKAKANTLTESKREDGGAADESKDDSADKQQPS